MVNDTSSISGTQVGGRRQDAARRRQVARLVGATVLAIAAGVALPVMLDRLSPPDTSIWILPHYYVVAALMGLVIVWSWFGLPRWTTFERWLALLLPVLVATTAMFLLTPEYDYVEVRCGPPPASPNDPGAMCIDQRGEVVAPGAPNVATPVPWPLRDRVLAVFATTAVALRLSWPSSRRARKLRYPGWSRPAKSEHESMEVDM